MVVIGYKGTPKERSNNWNMLLIKKQHVSTFSNPENDMELRVRDNAREEVKKRLKNYIRNAA